MYVCVGLYSMRIRRLLSHEYRLYMGKMTERNFRTDDDTEAGTDSHIMEESCWICQRDTNIFVKTFFASYCLLKKKKCLTRKQFVETNL